MIDLANLEELRKKQIHFAIASCDGQMSVETFNSINKWKIVADQLEIRWSVDTIVHDIKSRAQNLLTAKFLSTFESTHMMLVGKNVAFEPQHILMLISSGKHIISSKGTHEMDMVDEGEIKEVADANTNFVLVSKEALGHLSKHAAVKEYKNPPVQDPYLKTFFGQGTDFNNFVSEDRLFTQRWRDIGGKSWRHYAVDVLDKY